MDDVLRDREARVAAAAQQHDVALAELRAHYEGKLAALSSEGDSRMAGEVVQAAPDVDGHSQGLGGLRRDGMGWWLSGDSGMVRVVGEWATPVTRHTIITLAPACWSCPIWQIPGMPCTCPML
jgi:hypothetical protein